MNFWAIVRFVIGRNQLRRCSKGSTASARCLALVTLLIGLGWLLCPTQAHAQAPRWTIPPGQETCVTSMLDPIGTDCERGDVRIQRFHIEAVFTCGKAIPVVVQLFHPDQCTDCTIRTARFAIKKGEPAPSDALVAAIAEQVKSRESEFRWEQPVSDGMGPPPEAPARFAWEWQSVAARSLIPWVLFAGLVVAWAWRRAGCWDKRDWFVAAGLFAVAACLRFAVPWVPANWYVDFAAPPEGSPMFGKGGFFQVSLLSYVLKAGGDRAVFATNSLLGAASASMAFLAAKCLTGTVRGAVAFGGLVATTPFFVRLSASDAPHVLVLFCFLLAALGVGTWLRGQSWIGISVAVAATLLAAPIRPDTAAGFWLLPWAVLWARGQSSQKQPKDRIAAWLLLCAALLGAVPWLLHVLGSSWHGEAFNFPDVGWLERIVLVVRRAAGVMAFWPTSLTEPLAPAVLKVGYVAGWVVLAVRREKRGMVFLALGLLGSSAAEVITNFGGSLENLAIGRYATLTAVVWMIPVAIALEAGARWVGERKGKRARMAAWVGAWLVVGGSSVPGYREISFYGQEYLFLREALPHEGTVVAIWGPSMKGGSDLDCCLAWPHLLLARSRPALQWYVVEPQRPDAREAVAAVARIPGAVVWYDGPLPGMTPQPFDGADANLMEAYLNNVRDLTRLLDDLGWNAPTREAVLEMAADDSLSSFRPGGGGGVKVGVRSRR